jgi:hypothetical protein
MCYFALCGENVVPSRPESRLDVGGLPQCDWGNAQLQTRRRDFEFLRLRNACDVSRVEQHDNVADLRKRLLATTCAGNSTITSVSTRPASSRS